MIGLKIISNILTKLKKNTSGLENLCREFMTLPQRLVCDNCNDSAADHIKIHYSGLTINICRNINCQKPQSGGTLSAGRAAHRKGLNTENQKCQHCNSFNLNISGHFERIGKGRVEQSEVYKVSFNRIIVLFFCFDFSFMKCILTILRKDG